MQSFEKITQPKSGDQENDSLPTDYPSWKADEKQSFLWHQRILLSQYERFPALKKIDVIGLFLTVLNKKMDCLADEAPRHWKKAIHAHASVAEIRFVPAAETPFTGLFRGADYGLLRLSLTGNPADRGFAPGLAVKFFLDGQPSANFSALVSLDGQGKNYNFFANEFSNIVPVVNRLGPKLINLIFRRASHFPTKLDLQNLGVVRQDGQVETTPHYPLRLFLVPNDNVQFAETPPHDFRTDLATIAPGTSLFSVYGVDPANVSDDRVDQLEDRQNAQLMGSIETTSAFVASDYGDRRLFFRHQRFRNQ
ncbi:hypothetical protein [Stenomitos frigidus]|uniref:Catalase n=1 Tax=Stenomitos frigidus ULC18 TaxID=2107698 RepID=A0A2T1DUD1_9CYAN|nr:hypothetical protein [Stenomitos frigidus]PSB24113.1 hypothetical protein C7B82_28220 [Stenomitos frigidus ULC18]